MKIEIWSDFACPFCYIGKKRFEAALNQFMHKNQVEVSIKRINSIRMHRHP